MKDRRIKVLWLVKGLGPGGAEMLLVSMARTGDHQRFDYHAAYVLPWKDKLVAPLENAGVTVHLVGRSTSDLRWLLSLRRLVLREHFDVVHLHSPLIAGMFRLLLLSVRPSHRPITMATEHNTWSSFALVTRVINALLIRRDSAIMAVSEEVQHSIWSSIRPRSEVLVHGVVLDGAAPVDRAAMRQRLGFTDDEVVAVTVANYRAQKGYPDLLSAAQQVIARHPRVRFLAIGQGPLEPEITALHAQLGLGERFQLLGYRDDVADVLTACDLFVLASLHEGFPIAVMESLVAGLPVVSTAVGGVPSVIIDGEQGLLVTPGHPEQLAAAISRMVSDEQLRLSCGAKARALRDQFDIRRATEHLESTYRRVLEDA